MNNRRVMTAARGALVAVVLLSTLAVCQAGEPSVDKARAQAALAPIILDGMIPEFIGRNREALLREANAEKGRRVTPFLNDTLGFGLTEFYRQAGIHEYDWQQL